MSTALESAGRWVGLCFVPRTAPARMHRFALPLTLLLVRGAAPAAQPMLLAEPVAEATAAPYATGSFEYLYDDGAANVNIGPPSTFDPDMLWGNYFFSDPAGQVITEVSVAFGPTFPSASTEPVTFWILDDPDGDADPRTNATVLWSTDAMPDTLGGNAFFHVTVDSPVEVSTGFFVGASVFLQGGEDRPARVDTGARADRSWFFYAPDIAAVIDSLAGAPFGTRMDNTANVPFPGAFMVRAMGQPVVAADGGPMATDLALAAAPNPVGRDASLTFQTPAPGPVMLEVLDPLGRNIATLVDGHLEAGHHGVRWETAGAAAGVYVARLRVGPALKTITLVVSR